MATAVQITLIICATIISLYAIAAWGYVNHVTIKGVDPEEDGKEDEE